MTGAPEKINGLRTTDNDQRTTTEETMPRALILTLFLAAGAAHGQTCTEGAPGDATPPAFAPLSAADVDAIVKAADGATSAGTATIAVVDRAGRVLALLRQPHADANNDDQAVGVARTAAFF